MRLTNHLELLHINNCNDLIIIGLLLTISAKNCPTIAFEVDYTTNNTERLSVNGTRSTENREALPPEEIVANAHTERLYGTKQATTSNTLVGLVLTGSLYAANSEE